MAVAVFAEDATLYNTMITHATVGANPDPTIDYAISIHISGKPVYYGQVTEIERDQGHPVRGLRTLAYMGLTSNIQGNIRGLYTNFYTYSNSRLFAGWEYWATYNGGKMFRRNQGLLGQIRGRCGLLLALPIEVLTTMTEPAL